jgi:hypothetical protein
MTVDTSLQHVSAQISHFPRESFPKINAATLAEKRN